MSRFGAPVLALLLLSGCSSGRPGAASAVGERCGTVADCEVGAACASGVCTALCNLTLECAPELAWLSGLCVPPVCGDGHVDGKERCDGDCPDSCDDGDACTLDSSTGSAALCTFKSGGTAGRVRLGS